MARETEYESLGVNVLVRIREDDPRHGAILEALSASINGLRIVGLESDSGWLTVSLQVEAASWEAAVSHVEARLDGLAFDWRRHASCVRP
jgi:hypothetical protein